MTKADLQKIYDEEKAAKRNRIKAEREYIEGHGLKIGTKVKVKTGWKKGGVGLVVSRKISSFLRIEIEYTIGKITKSGSFHKTARIDWCVKREDLEVIK
jgi:hypothetical protein